MKKLCIVILSLAAAVSVFPQTRTVTNADLEKFRAERLENERKLKERYRELGFPSPEQIERQTAARRAELEQYSDQLRIERIARENAARDNALYERIDDLSDEVDYLRNQIYYNSGGVYAVAYPFFGYNKNRTLRRISRLPPNMRTVREYALGYPNTPGLNRQFAARRGYTNFGGTRIGGTIRFGGGRGFSGRGFFISGSPR